MTIGLPDDVTIGGTLQVNGNTTLGNANSDNTTIRGVVTIQDHGSSSKGLKLGGTLVTASATDLNFVSGVSAGNASASKAVVLSSSKNITGLGTIGCGAITSTGKVTSTSAEIDNIVNDTNTILWKVKGGVIDDYMYIRHKVGDGVDRLRIGAYDSTGSGAEIGDRPFEIRGSNILLTPVSNVGIGTVSPDTNYTLLVVVSSQAI